MEIALLLVAFVAVFGLVHRLLGYATGRGLLDVPNARSSHEVPTPRGGGLAIALVVLAALPVMGGLGWLAWTTVAALAGAGLLVTLVGWRDDHVDVPAGWRLLAHAVAAGWGLAWLGGLPPLVLLGTPMDLGWIGHALAWLFLVWLLNLYNFMDGINGIAAIEALTVGFAMSVLTGWLGVGHDWLLPALLAVAASGFLGWNFPRARIFMGDGGSGFVGLMLGLLSIQAAGVAPDFFWAWLILLGMFIVDATLTLLRRLWRGDRIMDPHRTHAYQHAARMAGSHVPVALAYGMLNVLWLLPVASLVALGHLGGIVGVMIAYAPLVAGAWWFRAGVPEAGRVAGA